MRQFLLLIILLFSKFYLAYNQTAISQGHPIAEIFTDFKLNLNDSTNKTGFELNRAHLGYNFIPDEHFSAEIIVNVGIPDELAHGSLPRRYAYFREASITYSNEKLNITFGITGTRLFDFQQRFWGKRYIANTYQSINGYGFVADLGVAVDYRINDIVKADLTLMNGEGFSNIQVDNSLRTATGVTITPGSHFAFRIYGDIMRKDNIWQPMFIGFAGYKSKRITIGGEFTYKSNLDLEKGHNAWGFSGTGGINLTKKIELFARYDNSTSSMIPSEDIRWNYQRDGTLFILGLQHTFNEHVKIALDYQGTHPDNPDSQKSEALLINALFRFDK